MKISFTNISFLGGVNTDTPHKKPNRRTRTIGSIIEPIDNGNPRTAIRTTSYGKVMPTPFEDCFEKMSFEDPEEDNIWRDAQYEDEYDHSASYNDDINPHIIFEKPYIAKNYSEDDIPVSDSVIRRTLGFNHLADVRTDFDTDIDIDDKKRLDQINYNENIFPRVIRGVDYVTQQEFSKLAAEYKNSGFAAQTILSAAERCHLQGYRSRYGIPNINLFEFLIENPNLRKLVVTIDNNNNEVFDRSCATYFKTFQRYLPDADTTKSVLELCKTYNDGAQLVNRNLCEIVILTRLKSAQGIEEPKTNYSPEYYDSPSRRYEKYVKKSTPLTEQDIELIQKLKSGDQLDSTMYSVAKSLLSDKKMTVEFVLKNIDKFSVRKNKINKIISELNKKTGLPTSATVVEIKGILDNEFDVSVSDPLNPKKDTLLLDATKKLMKDDYKIADIAIILKKLEIFKKRMTIDNDFVNKYTELLSEKDEEGKVTINRTLADILTKLVLSSREISDTDVEIINLVKKHKSKDPRIVGFTNNLLNRADSKEEVLTAIKEKIEADKAPKQANNTTTQNKDAQKNAKVINIKGKRYNVPHGTVLTISNGKIITRSIIDYPAMSDEERQGLQLATMLDRLLIPGSMQIGSAIVNTIQFSKGKERQMWLDFVESRLKQGCSTEQILIAIKEEKLARKKAEAQQASERYNDGSYISQLMKERFTGEEILDLEEKLDSKNKEKPQRTIVIKDGNNQIIFQSEDTEIKNLTEEEIESEIAKIEKILLGSSRMLEMTDETIIRMLKTSKKEKQPELIDMVNDMLNKWCSSKEILAALRKKSQQ